MLIKKEQKSRSDNSDPVSYCTLTFEITASYFSCVQSIFLTVSIAAKLDGDRYAWSHWTISNHE